jgi:hypothetical protein
MEYNQIEAVTGRKPKFNWADIIRAEAPVAKERFFNNRAMGLQKEQMKMQEDAMEAQQRQATMSNAISTATVGQKVAPYLSKGAGALADVGKGAYNWMTGPSAVEAAAAESAAVGGNMSTAPIMAEGVSTAPVIGSAGGGGLAATEGAMAGGEMTAGLGTSQAAAGTGTGSAAGSSWWTGPAIAAAIIAQNMATNDTDTVVEGQQTGNVFSTDEKGSWKPRFFTEPWMGWASDKLGHKEATPGEKFDAAVQNKDWGNVARRTPSTAYQWFDPVGQMGRGMFREGWRSAGLEKKKEQDLAMTFGLDPIGGITSLAEDTYLCSQVRRARGLDDAETEALAVFRRYALESHPETTLHYLMYGPELVMAIAAKEDTEKFYTTLYEEMVKPVINMTRDGLMEEAYQLYKTRTHELMAQYTELSPPQED